MAWFGKLSSLSLAAALIILAMAAAAFAQTQGQSQGQPQGGGWTPPPRGAPDGRVGGASRDIAPSENPATATPLASDDAGLWEAIKNSSEPGDFEGFLRRYPNSDFASLAERRLVKLRAQPAPAPK
jgi:hypothetical protein